MQVGVNKKQVMIRSLQKKEAQDYVTVPRLLNLIITIMYF